MRTFKLALLGTLLVTFTLLVFDVVDFCRVDDQGAVHWAPTVRTAAVRRYSLALWHAGRDAVSPAPQPEPQTAAAHR